jgi:carboxylate-amine ligase
MLSLTALTHCLVIEGLQILEEQPDRQQGDPHRFWLAAENRWLATRYGLHAQCMRHLGGTRLSLADDTEQLIERLMPTAQRVGEDAFLSSLQPVSQIETGAERQRRIYRQTGSWQPVIEDMKTRWLPELDEAQAPAST